MNFLLFRRNASVLAGLSVVFFLGWFWAVPTVMSPSTFASVAVFLLGGAAVSLMTWRNAQATGSTALLLHATETSSGNVELRRRLEPKDHVAPDIDDRS